MSFTVTINYPYAKNPEWRPENANVIHYYAPKIVEAEVLSLHFSTGNMRVRFNLDGKVKTYDTSIEPFFNKYDIKLSEI